jgi:NADH-quinone oxidoreductase subunit F
VSGPYPQVLLKHRKPDRITTLAEYRQAGGYEALKRTLTSADTTAVKAELNDAVLLGRGGAGFPAGIKVQTVAEDAPYPRYVICNADEMEPGTFKDRVFLHAEPHMLIEGMILAAYSIQASHGIIFIRPEYESAARILEREVGIAKREGLLGAPYWALTLDSTSMCTAAAGVISVARSLPRSMRCRAFVPIPNSRRLTPPTRGCGGSRPW